MGWKYTIEGKNSGYCYIALATTNTSCFIKALVMLIIYRFKYPIVNFAIRNGYVSCGKCTELNNCPKHYDNNK